MATMAANASKNTESDRRKSVGGWPTQEQNYNQDETHRRQSYTGYILYYIEVRINMINSINPK